MHTRFCAKLYHPLPHGGEYLLVDPLLSLELLVSQCHSPPLSLFHTHKHSFFHQEAARRCKMEFISRADDRKPRWVITESHPEPKLIEDTTEASLSTKMDQDGDNESEETGA